MVSGSIFMLFGALLFILNCGDAYRFWDKNQLKGCYFSGLLSI